jgi:hypothetical protein
VDRDIFCKNSGSYAKAIGKFVELSLTETSHNEDFPDFFKNLPDGDEFAMVVVTMGG